MSTFQELDTLANTPAAWDERAETAPTAWDACLWSPESQRGRLEEIVAALRPQPGESLLDFGCGTGELVRYLPGGIEYVGVDWSPGMLARASREHPGYRFQQHLPAAADLVACAGPFNLSDHWSKVRTWATLTTLWGLAGRALAVSLLGQVGEEPGREENLVYTPDECREFAERLADDVTLEFWRPGDMLLTLRR